MKGSWEELNGGSAVFNFGSVGEHNGSGIIW